MKILVVEDDPHILLGLEDALTGDGFEVVTCRRGDEALERIRAERPALIILDIMLPGLSGYDICKEARAKSIRTPIMMLTAKSQEHDKVNGLDLGADDYLTKPFGVRELMARVHSLLRRADTSAASKHEEAVFKIGGAEINAKTFEILRDGRSKSLTARELKLLQYFYRHPNEVLSRDRLLNEVWGYHYYGTTRTLDQVVVQLRRKLGDQGGEPRHLLTVHGVGYKLAV